MSAMFPPALIAAVCSARWSAPSATVAAHYGLTKPQVWKIWERHRGLIPARPRNNEGSDLSTPARSVPLAASFGVTAVERVVGGMSVSLARVRFLDGETML